MKFFNYILLSILTISSLLIIQVKFIVFYGFSNFFASVSLFVSIIIIIIYLYKINQNKSKSLLKSAFIILLIFFNSFMFFTKTLPYLYHLNSNLYPITNIIEIVNDNNPIYFSFIGGIIKVDNNIFPHNIIFVDELDTSSSAKGNYLRIISAQDSGLGYSYNEVLLNNISSHNKKSNDNKKLRVDRNKIPTNKFLATHRSYIDPLLITPWKDDGTYRYEIVDNISIDYSRHMNISQYLNSKWEGYFESTKDEKLKVEIRSDKAIKIFVNNKLVISGRNGHPKLTFIKLKKGRNLIKVLHQGRGAKIKISKDTSKDELKSYLKDKNYDLWYISANEYLRKNKSDILINLMNSDRPILLYVKSKLKQRLNFINFMSNNIIAVIYDYGDTLYMGGLDINDGDKHFPDRKYFVINSKFEAFNLTPKCSSLNNEVTCSSKGISNISFYLNNLLGKRIKVFLGIDKVTEEEYYITNDNIISNNDYKSIQNLYFKIEEEIKKSDSLEDDKIKLFYNY